MRTGGKDIGAYANSTILGTSITKNRLEGAVYIFRSDYYVKVKVANY